MVDVRLDGDRMVFEVEGWDKILALKSRLEIPSGISRARVRTMTPPRAGGTA